MNRLIISGGFFDAFIIFINNIIIPYKIFNDIIFTENGNQII